MSSSTGEALLEATWPKSLPLPFGGGTPRHGLLLPLRGGGRGWGTKWSLALALFFVACGPTARPDGPTTPRPIGHLHPPSHYGLELTIDQEVTAEHAGGSERFRAVLEIRGDRLVMVGLGPHGGRAFVLTQDGESVRFASQMPRELPFPPEFMLMDVHRAWLMGIPREGGAPLPDGEHDAFIEGENVHEVWSGGRLVSRSFHILASNLAYWSVRITYEGGLGPSELPTRVILESHPAPDQSYRLILENLSGSMSRP